MRHLFPFRSFFPAYSPSLMTYVYLLLVCSILNCCCATEGETYSEKVYIKELANRDLSVLLRFSITAKQSDKLSLISLTLRQIFDNDIEWLRLSMTSGFYKTNLWGFSQQQHAPTGIALAVKFADGSTNRSQTWSVLVKQLNGLFCSSIHEMDPFLTTLPDFLLPSGNRSLYRYGHLSGEPVCSENINSFLMILPCMHTGLATSIDLDELYREPYYSMVVEADLLPSPTGGRPTWKADLSLHYVKSHQHLLETNGRPYYLDLKSRHACSVAQDQKLFLAEMLNYEPNMPVPGDGLDLLKPTDTQLRAFYLRRNATGVGKPRVEALPFKISVYREKFDSRGGIIGTTVTNNVDRPMDAIYFHTIPWQIHLEIDTLEYFCKNPKGEITKPHLSNKFFDPAINWNKPATLAFGITLPPDSECTVKYTFVNSLMTSLAYPPDSHFGIFCPSPIISIPLSTEAYDDFFTGQPDEYERERQRGHALSLFVQQTLQLYGEPLLILLPVPDFSMPFNVICITTTVTGFMFGSALTAAVKPFLPNLEVSDEKSGFINKLKNKIQPLLAAVFAVFGRKKKEE